MKNEDLSLTLNQYRTWVESHENWQDVYAALFPDYDASDPEWFSRCSEQDFEDGPSAWAFPAYTPEGPRANPDDYTCLPECADTQYVGDHYALTEAEANALPRTAPGISTLDEFQDCRVIAKNRDGIPVASWFSH